MKFLTLSAYALLIVSTEAANLKRHNVPGVTFLQTLPDVRADTVAEEDIAAHEKARKEAAYVKKNPKFDLLASVKADLEEINNDMSFGVSYSQKSRNEHAVTVCQKVAKAIIDYSKALISSVDSTSADNKLNEQNAHNIASMIFFDVQLEDAMAALGMSPNEELILNVNRLKSMQKLYLFEQQGGENYLG